MPPDRDAVEALKKLGLTEYEAKTYVGLVSVGQETVVGLYEIAGVPRSAIYGTLKSLETRGLAEAQYGRPLRYRPVPPELGVRKLRLALERAEKTATERLKTLSERPRKKVGDEEKVWIVRGERNIIERICELLKRAESELLISLDFQDAEFLLPILREVEIKGVTIRMLTGSVNEEELHKSDLLLEFLRIVDVRCIRRTLFSPEGPLRVVMASRRVPAVGIVVVDGDEAFLDLRGMSSGAAGVGDLGIYSDVPSLVSLFQWTFNTIWEECEPPLTAHSSPNDRG